MFLRTSTSRRDFLALGAGAGAAWLAGPAHAGQPVEAVVELFSSQGCRSCPAADRLLGELRGMPGVLALTLHVDYWDYLGWKDTLASPEFSQRQYDYAKARGDMDVFTPQMIVNGEKQMVGSQRSEVFAVLEQSRRKSWPAALEISHSAKEMVIEIGASEQQQDATLWVMPVMEHASVKIEKGEMAGREASYVNVVRKLVPAGMWTGAAARVALPKEGLMPPGATACVALLQQGKLGPVLGCACWGTVTS
jgi:hypothetical protein